MYEQGLPSHYDKRCNSCVDDQTIVSEAPSDPPALPILDGLALNTTYAHVEHRVEVAQDFLVVVQDPERDDENAQNALPVNVLCEANCTPTTGYDDNQVLFLMNTIAERPVYFKAS